MTDRSIYLVVTEEKLGTSSHAPLWRNSDAIAITVLMCLTIIVMVHRWVFDNWLARHDLLTFFLPWLGALGDRLRALDVPALNPYIFSGAPFAGDPESGWMFLPAMLTFPFFEVTVAYKLMILLLLVLAGTSTYALARLVGYSVLAALFSAVAVRVRPIPVRPDRLLHGRHQDDRLPAAGLPRRGAGAAGEVLANSARGMGPRRTRDQPDVRRLARAGRRQCAPAVAAWVVFRTIITPPDTGLGA